MAFPSKHLIVNTRAVPDAAPFSGTEKPVRAILFDMDNTLFDLVGAQMTACNAVMKSLGVGEKNPPENLLFEYFLRPVHGFEAHENIRDFMQDHGISVPGSYDSARRLYEQEKIHAIMPYPGVIETLTRIRERGLPMGIITDAHSRDAVRRLEKTGLLPFFDCMVTFDLAGVKKPAHEPFFIALGMLQSEAGSVLLVGDSPRRDIEPGKRLGMRTAYARYGDRFSDDRSPVRADYTLDCLSDLSPILDRLSC